MCVLPCATMQAILHRKAKSRVRESLVPALVSFANIFGVHFRGPTAPSVLQVDWRRLAIAVNKVAGGARMATSWDGQASTNHPASS